MVHTLVCQKVIWLKTTNHSTGNYIISGGLETVLVLWQLDTGRKQFLPHLSSPICNLVVSPTGKSYAVKLADNTAMVLSTSNLRPIASMSGLQLPSDADLAGRKPHTKGSISKYPEVEIDDGQICDILPAVLHPVNTDHLLLATPSDPVSRKNSSNVSFLQTFDLRSGHHIS